MPHIATHLSEKHALQLQTAVDEALRQWAPGVKEPLEILTALERVLLFLKQNGGASAQARQVASLAFVFGHQVVRTAQWTWHSVSDDGAFNPSIVAPDGRTALLVVDVITGWVTGELKLSLRELYLACVEGRPHPQLTALS